MAYGSINTPLPDLSDWQAQDFVFDDDIFNGSLSTDMNPSLTLGQQRILESPAQTNQTDSPTMPRYLNSWVSDLAALNANVWAFISTNDGSSTDSAGRELGESRMQGMREAVSPPARSNFEPAFRMANELSALVNRLRQGQDRGSRSPNHRTGGDTVMLHSESDEQVQQERQVSRILNEPSNILLLSSTYSRLLDLFMSTIPTAQTQSPRSSVNVTLGAVDLSSRPNMETYVIVNMVEMVLRRMDQVLKLVDEEADLDGRTGSRTRPADDLPYEQRRTSRGGGRGAPGDGPRGLGFVLEMVGDRQSALLHAARESRRQLLANAEM